MQAGNVGLCEMGIPILVIISLVLAVDAQGPAHMARQSMLARGWWGNLRIPRLHPSSPHVDTLQCRQRSCGNLVLCQITLAARKCPATALRTISSMNSANRAQWWFIVPRGALACLRATCTAPIRIGYIRQSAQLRSMRGSLLVTVERCAACYLGCLVRMPTDV